MKHRCECGNRVVVLPSKAKSRRSWGTATAVKGHDLCHKCFSELLTRSHAVQAAHGMRTLSRFSANASMTVSA